MDLDHHQNNPAEPPRHDSPATLEELLQAIADDVAATGALDDRTPEAHFESIITAIVHVLTIRHAETAGVLAAHDHDEPLLPLVLNRLHDLESLFDFNHSIEQIGHIYESMLAFRLERTSNGLRVIATDHRRAHGVHFTPAGVAECMARCTLQPLLYAPDANDAQNADDDELIDDVTDLAPLAGEHEAPTAPAPETPEASLITPDRILALRICDPAMGAAAMLLAAGRFLSDRLIESVRLHDESLPTRKGEDEHAAARRLVVQHCLHGVDLSPVTVDIAAASLWLFVASPSFSLNEAHANLRAGDALIDATDNLSQLNCERPLNWESEFPEVFDADRGGFDAVITNPPFGNAIEQQTARSSALAAYAAERFKPFAAGSYDLCLLFWARSLMHLLHQQGRYGFLSPTALLSDHKPWQTWMHKRWRPDAFILHPVDQFAAARIRTTAYIGGHGIRPTVTVTNMDDMGSAHTGELQEPRPIVRRWSDCSHAWYEAVSDAANIKIDQTDTVPLNDLVHIVAGCATGPAYELKSFVNDDLSATGMRLITTGAIDRYTCRWGQKRIRFLKDDYDHPRWPAPDDAPPSLVRAMHRQTRPKILVGGLTAVLEGWFDERGDSGGVVSTWALWARSESADHTRLLLPILNCATLSRLYIARYGGRSMSGRQTTIHKNSLGNLPLPADLFDAIDAHEPGERFIWPQDAAGNHGRAMLKRILFAAADALQTTPEDDPRWRKFDRLAHLAAARLFGRRLQHAEEDYRWWCERTRVDVLIDDPTTLTRTLNENTRADIRLAPPPSTSSSAA